MLLKFRLQQMAFESYHLQFNDYYPQSNSFVGSSRYEQPQQMQESWPCPSKSIEDGIGNTGNCFGSLPLSRFVSNINGQRNMESRDENSQSQSPQTDPNVVKSIALETHPAFFSMKENIELMYSSIKESFAGICQQINSLQNFLCSNQQLQTQSNLAPPTMVQAPVPIPVLPINQKQTVY